MKFFKNKKINKKDNIYSIIMYIIKYYGKNEIINKKDLINLLFIIDWKSSLRYGRQTTSNSWYLDDKLGVDLNIVSDTIKDILNSSIFIEFKDNNHKYIKIDNKFNKTYYDFNDLNLNIKTYEIINDVFNILSNKNINNSYELSSFLLKLYPIYITNFPFDKYEYMDLVELSKEYIKL